MSTLEKIKSKILSIPTANDFTPNEIQNFLSKYGFECVRKNGSHFVYQYPPDKNIKHFVIPMHNPIKPTYIDQIRERILMIEGE